MPGSRLHVARGRAERYANPDLLRTLADRVGDQRVDSKGRQHQRERREAPEQQDEEATRRDRLVHELLQEVARQIRRDRAERGSYGVCHLLGRQRRADDEIRGRQIEALTQRNVHLVPRRLLEGALCLQAS